MRGLILGFGNMGQNHYERYKKLGIERIEIIDIAEEKRTIAQSLGLAAHATLNDFLTQNKEQHIDFIDICLPTDLHFILLEQLMKNFAANPIPIMVEKPVVRTSQEAEQLSSLVQDYGKNIFVAEVEHYNSRINNFFESLNKPLSIKLSRRVNMAYFLKNTDHWSINPERSGGLILDLMIHDFSILDKFFGEAILLDGIFKKVSYPCVDEATVFLEYSNLKAELTGSWLSTDENPIILTIEAVEQEGGVKQLVLDDYIIRGEHYDYEDPFFLEIQHFLQMVKSNKAPSHLIGEYLRIVKLANNVIELANMKTTALTFEYFSAESSKLASGLNPCIEPTGQRP